MRVAQFMKTRRGKHTYVSTCGLQGQANECNGGTNEVAKSPRLHIEHTYGHDKTIQTRTFPTIVAIKLKVPTNRLDGRSLESNGGAR